VLADYGAVRNTVASLNDGLDFEPFPGVLYGPAAVNAALLTGQVSDARVDEHVRRILRTLFAYGFFDRDAYPYDDSRIDRAGHSAAARHLEEQGIVLLKNRGLLPLRRRDVGSLAVIGTDADRFKSGGGSSNVQPYAVTTPRQGIERRAAAAGIAVRYDSGQDPAAAAAVARASDVAVVVVADTSSEGTDKPCMGLDCGSGDAGGRDALVERVAAANPRTLVVLETGAPVLTPWRDRVGALLEAWYPGLEGGTAIARVLFGDVDPGGRLPATFPHSEGDYPYAGNREAYPGVAETVHYKEGVLVGYRWFDERGIRAAYPFGHGLWYTRFRFGGLRVVRTRRAHRVSAVVRNLGRRRGTAVPQLYLGLPDPAAGVVQPPRALKGFAKVPLRRKRARRVRFALGPRALSYFDAGSKRFRVAPGCYQVMLGASSRDIRMRSTLGVGRANTARARRAGRARVASTACAPRIRARSLPPRRH
jgi:beta-glucosidase